MYLQKPQTVDYIFAADNICTSRSILKQSCFKTRKFTLNDSTRKQYLAQMTIKVICFNVDEKPLGDYILRHNNFGLIYEISKHIATAKKQKW